MFQNQKYLIYIVHLIEYLILALAAEGYIESGIDSEGAKDTSAIPILLFSLRAVVSYVMGRGITLSVQRERYIAIVIKEQ